MGLFPRASAGVALTLLFACGASQSPATDPARSDATAPSVAPSAAPPLAPVSDGTIARSELLPVLDAGLGHFLRGVRVEASLVEGAFEGYRLTHLYPDDPRFQAIDLRPGDVVLRVNRRPIERPEQAQRVWDELRVASQLLVEYRREGEDRALRFAIVD